MQRAAYQPASTIWAGCGVGLWFYHFEPGTKAAIGACSEQAYILIVGAVIFTGQRVTQHRAQ
jgi:hypothetical protein